MTRGEACPRNAVHGLAWCVVALGVLAGCSETPKLQLQVPRAPKTQNALGGTGAASVTATATFDAPVIDVNTWQGTPIGTGTFNVALTPAASGGPTSIAFSDPQGTDRYVIVADFNATSGHGLALISDSGWTVGANQLSGGKTAVVFDLATGDVVGIAQVGTVTLTAAGSSVGQRVTGSLNAAFVPYAPTPACQVDADCARGEICQAGQCMVAPSGCSSNSQCSVGEVCQAGVCVPTTPVCVVDSDCATGQQCQAGVCVTTSPSCVVDSDCAAGQQCQAGQCVASPSCTSSAQCARGEQCVSGQCVVISSGCTSNTQCGAGFVCQAGACVPGSSGGPCSPKRGTGSTSGTLGALNTCSALGSGSFSLSQGLAAIDDDQGQLALFIVDANTQRDGVVVELNACPAGPSTSNGLAVQLFKTTTLSNGVVLTAQIPGTASIQWTQVGATLAGTISITLSSGGAVTGSFNVQ